MNLKYKTAHTSNSFFFFSNVRLTTFPRDYHFEFGGGFNNFNNPESYTILTGLWAPSRLIIADQVKKREERKKDRILNQYKEHILHIHIYKKKKRWEAMKIGKQHCINRNRGKFLNFQRGKDQSGYIKKNPSWCGSKTMANLYKFMKDKDVSVTTTVKRKWFFSGKCTAVKNVYWWRVRERRQMILNYSIDLESVVKSNCK